MDGLLAGDAPPADQTQSFDHVPDVPPVSAPDAPPAVEAAPATEEPAEPAPAAEVAPVTAPAPGDLPTGVKVRKLDGKDVWAVDPAVGQKAFERSALVDEAEQILGEPLSKEALEFRQKTVEGFEGMRGDLLSDNPADQANVVNHLAEVIRGAQANGEIGHDALSSLVKVTIDQSLNGDPAFAGQILDHVAANDKVLRRQLDSVYELALNEPDAEVAKALWNSAQQIDNKKFGDYRRVQEMDYLRSSGAKTLPTYQKNTPAAAAPAPAAQPAAAPAGNAAQKQAYTDWSNTTNKAIHDQVVVKNVDTAIDAAVPKEQRDKYPENFKSVKNQLISAVRDGLLGDQKLREQTATIQNRARLAVSPEVRNQLQQELVRRHNAAAERILRETKGPILTEYAQLMAAKSNTEASRAAAGQRVGRQAPPSGGPATARQGVPRPASTGKFSNVGDFNKELEGALA